LNSSEVAKAVRAGDLEARVVQLPIDDHGLVVSKPVLIDTVVYVCSDIGRTRHPVSIEQLASAQLVLSEARWQHDDPLRRSIAERRRAAGVSIAPFVEVEFQSAAMELAANGVGDTMVSYLVARTHESANRVTWVPLDPPFEEKFAFVTKTNGVLSSATRQFMVLANRHISALQDTASKWRAEYEAGRENHARRTQGGQE
jgi:DNA-binding transcriptional LysR family regulator